MRRVKVRARIKQRIVVSYLFVLLCLNFILFDYSVLGSPNYPTTPQVIATDTVNYLEDKLLLHVGFEKGGEDNFECEQSYSFMVLDYHSGELPSRSTIAKFGRYSANFSSEGYLRTKATGTDSTLPTPPTGSAWNYTVSLWVKFYGIPSKSIALFSAWYYLRIFVNNDTGLVEVYMNDGTRWDAWTNVLNSTTNVLDNTWHNIFLAYNTSSKKVYLYIDNVLEGETTFTAKNYEQGTYGIYIGGEKCLLDEIIVYNATIFPPLNYPQIKKVVTKWNDGKLSVTVEAQNTETIELSVLRKTAWKVINFTEIENATSKVVLASIRYIGGYYFVGGGYEDESEAFLYRSKDGIHWEKVFSITEARQIWGISGLPNGTIVIGTYGVGVCKNKERVYRSDDFGETWTLLGDFGDIAGARHIHDVLIDHKGNIYVLCGEEGKGLWKYNGTGTWYNLTFSSDNYLRIIEANNILYLTSEVPGNLWYSTDYGETWTLIDKGVDSASQYWGIYVYGDNYYITGIREYWVGFLKLISPNGNKFLLWTSNCIERGLIINNNILYVGDREGNLYMSLLSKTGISFWAIQKFSDKITDLAIINDYIYVVIGDGNLYYAPVLNPQTIQIQTKPNTEVTITLDEMTRYYLSDSLHLFITAYGKNGLINCTLIEISNPNTEVYIKDITDAKVISVSFVKPRLYVTLDASTGTDSKTVIYTADYGKPSTVKRRDTGTKLREVPTLSDLDKLTNCWYYDSTNKLLYVKVSHHSEASVEVVWSRFPNVWYQFRDIIIMVFPLLALTVIILIAVLLLGILLGSSQTVDVKIVVTIVILIIMVLIGSFLASQLESAFGW
ncbi:hypothetical protein DRN63_01605 [Nanoarchaeota archaeon]|nr:MAG: hypothetical protein DRN63_01605 [Nanoarchaeota archaeon]